MGWKLAVDIIHRAWDKFKHVTVLHDLDPHTVFDRQ